MATRQLDSRHRTILSCLRCHQLKRKCNRKCPCSHCLGQGILCRYQVMSHDAAIHIAAETTEEAEESLRELVRKTWQVQDDRRPSKRVNRPAKCLVDIRNPYSWYCSFHSNELCSKVKTPSSCKNDLVLYLLHSFASLFTTRSSACSQPPPAIEPQTLGVMMQTKSVIFATTFLSARMYAAELEHTFNRPPPTSCLPLKLAAMQQIREAVLTSAIFSDELILGVLFLALSHNKNIDPLNEDQYHIDAAEKMIKARGGLYKLKCDQSIVNLFLWCRQTQGNSSLCLGNILDV
ncbi:hypothetical protein V2G26_007120 [Clonostachys chloroleuca]